MNQTKLLANDRTFLFFVRHLFLLLILLVNLNCTLSQNNNYKQRDKVHKITWEKPYTSDIRYYQVSLNKWKDTYPHYVSHFPDKLSKSNTYDFFYMPRIMQAGSIIELKITFPSKIEALNFFKEESNGCDVEFTSYQKARYSMYCMSNSFYSDSLYDTSSVDKVRLLNPTWCAGQGDRKLGGISSSIYLDSKNNTVFCLAIDNSF